MPLLLTLDQAKKHVNVTLSTDDDDLERKLTQAQAMVLDELSDRVSDADDWAATVAAWTEDTVDPRITAAIAIQFGELVRFRGDDEKDDAARMSSLHPRALSIVRRFCDPAMA